MSKTFMAAVLGICVGLTFCGAFMSYNNNVLITTLARSHAVMWERQEMLKKITCGYCHSKVPDWCDKHDGGE